MSSWREMAAKALAQPAPAEAQHSAAKSPIGDGLQRLQAMEMPRGSDAGRWRQIIEDAAAFVATWEYTAERLGWQVSDVFGCDLDDESGTLGLIFHVRGRRVVLVDADSAIIRGSDRHDIFYRGRCADAPPVWTLARKGISHER